MENWDKPTRDHRKQHHRENPSFSSTLLDAIYRSIDEGQQQAEEKQQQHQHQQQKLVFYRETMRKQQKQQKDNNREEDGDFIAHKPNSRRTVEIWKANEKVVKGRNSLTELERTRRSNSINALSMYSCSTSSESSSAGGFSSSESESFFGIHRPKPIRTSFSEKTNNAENHKQHKNHLPHTKTEKSKHNNHNNNNNNNNGFGNKTKTKALRILYGELKKSKQPISPGAKLASFLNSLFNSNGNAKKAAKVVSSPQDQGGVSTCSSASSFSRSCLSKTPSSRTGVKRSVSFCPVSVIVDEDCRPCGHKNLHEEGIVQKKGDGDGYGYGYSYNKGYGYGKSSEELRLHVLQESRRVEELARDLLKNYQKKNEQDFDMMMNYDDDDGASCCSSDLFELDNLSAIGIERYREELPVYETTIFNPNRVIANGLIL